MTLDSPRLMGLVLVGAVMALAREVRSAEAAFEAEIIALDAMAYSGPGAGFYPTQDLRRGERVTVIGERTGDWVAIDPPDGSFSWLPTKVVQEQEDGTGVVTAEETRVYVGSRLNDARHVFQIRAKKGDKVEILDHVYVKDEKEVDSWYKIKPPAGEVRYVPLNQLRLPAAAGNSAARSSGARPASPWGTLADPLAPTADTPTAGAPAAAAPRVVTRRIIAPAEPIGATEPSVLAEVAANNSSAPTPASTAEKVGDTTQPPVDWIDDADRPLEARIQSLQNQMRLLGSRSPETWDLASGKSIVEALQESAPTAELRSQVMDLRLELQRLEGLKEQYDRARRKWELSRQKDDELAALQRRIESEVRRLAPRFDAEGTLEEGALSVDGRPSYVLKNRDGVTTHYLLAAPGMAIRPYLGQKVGVHGATSTRPGLPAPLLDLEQLTPLEER